MYANINPRNVWYDYVKDSVGVGMGLRYPDRRLEYWCKS